MNRSDYKFWIGASTEGPGSPAPGITPFILDGDGQPRLGFSEQVGQNPMFLASASEDPGLIAVAHELEEGRVSLHRLVDGVVESVGTSAVTDRVATCHVAITRAGDLVLAANYGAPQCGAGLSVHPVGEAGVGESSLIVEYPGSGPVQDRQEASHAHQVTVDEDGNRVYVCDLGADAIHVHRLSDLRAGISAYTDIRVPSGSGPRHLVVDGNRLLVVGELDNVVRALDVDSCAQVASTPSTKREGANSLASAICLGPRGLLYVGNRGPNTVGVLRWNKVSDTLVFLGEYDCGGDHPRDMSLTADGRYLIVANQWSDQLAVLDAGHEQGILETVAVIDSPSPACVLPVR